jgi:TPR repeat protein
MQADKKEIRQKLTLGQLIEQLEKLNSIIGMADAILLLKDLGKSILEDNNKKEQKLIVEKVRKILYSSLNAEENYVLNNPDLIYDVLFYLAENWPLNKKDPIFLTKIEEQNRVVLATGHQFDIFTLIKYHHSRYYRGSDLKEQADSKWLINPIINKKIHPRDVRHIQNVAESKGIKIGQLLTADHLYREGEAIVNDRNSDFSEGESLLLQAAHEGQGDAAYLLARIYTDDFANERSIRMGGPGWWGKKQNYRLALQYLMHAIKAGHQGAKLRYISYLLKGKDELKIQPEPKRALEYIEQLIKQDYLPAILLKLEMLSEYGGYKIVTKQPDVENEVEQFIEEQEKYDTDIVFALEKLKDFAERGSVKATTLLIEIYKHDTDDNQIEPDEKKVEYYTGLLERFNLEEGVEILTLLEKASKLGHAESSKLLAEIFLQGENHQFDNLKINPDIQKGLAYLHLSLELGNIKAGLELGRIYTDDFLSLLRENPDKVPNDLKKAKQVLKKAVNIKDSDYAKTNCAFLLAQIYREERTEEKLIEKQKEKVIKYYKIASDGHNTDAKSKLAALYIVGDESLGVEPDLSAAEQLLKKSTKNEAYHVAREIAAIGKNSKEQISKYLEYYFKSIERKEYCKGNGLDFLLHLLKTGRTLMYRGVEGSLTMEPHPILARKWKDFIEDVKQPHSEKHGFSYIKSKSKKDNEEKAKIEEKFNQLVKETFLELNLECPFQFTKKVKDSITLEVMNPHTGLPMRMRLSASSLPAGGFRGFFFGSSHMPASADDVFEDPTFNNNSQTHG